MSKIALLLFAAAPLFAQLESHTLAISATRTIAPQPDQVVFGLSVSSAASTTLDQVVAALSGLGITDANLTGVTNSVAFQRGFTFQWGFTLVAPSPTCLRQSPPSSNSRKLSVKTTAAWR
jgi:hypothetical protein